MPLIRASRLCVARGIAREVLNITGTMSGARLDEFSFDYFDKYVIDRASCAAIGVVTKENWHGGQAYCGVTGPFGISSGIRSHEPNIGLGNKHKG